MDTLPPANDYLMPVRSTTKRGPAGTLRGYRSASALPSEATRTGDSGFDHPEQPARSRGEAAASGGLDNSRAKTAATLKSGLRRKSDDGASLRLSGTREEDADTDTEVGRLRRDGGKRRQLAPAASDAADRSSSTPSSSTASSSRSTPDPAQRRSSPIRVRSPGVGGGSNAPALRARTPSGSGGKTGPGSTAASKLAAKPKMSRHALTPLDVDLHGQQQQQQQQYRRTLATSTLDGLAATRCRSNPRRTTAPAALLRAPASSGMSPSTSSSGRSSGGSSGTLTHGEPSSSRSSLRSHDGSYTPPLLSSAAMAITSSNASSLSAVSTHTATNSPVGPCPNPRGSTLSLLGQDLVLPPCVTPTEVVAYGGEAGGKALEAQVCQHQQQRQQEQHLMPIDDAYVRDDGVYCPVPTVPTSTLTGSGHSSHATTSAASSRRTSLSGEPKKRRSLSVATTASSMSMSSISAASGAVGGGATALSAQLTMTSATPTTGGAGSSLLTAEQLRAAESLPSPLASPSSRTSLGSLPGVTTLTSKQGQSQRGGGRKRSDAALVDLEALRTDEDGANGEDEDDDDDENADGDGDGSTIKRPAPTRPPLPSYTSFEDVGIPRPPSPPPSPPATGGEGGGHADGTAVTSKSWWQL